VYNITVKSSASAFVETYDVLLLLFMLPDYRYGICLTNTQNNKVLIMLTARNEHDRKNFIDDLRETILEVM